MISVHYISLIPLDLCLPAFQITLQVPAWGLFALPVSVICGWVAGAWKPGRPVLQVCAYLSARVLDIHSRNLPGETAEETLRSKEFEAGRSLVGKSVRRNLVIRITTTQGNHQHYQEWPQTGNRQQASFRKRLPQGKRSGVIQVSERKHSGRLANACLVFLKDFY